MPELALTFENGLYEGQEASLLPVGFATKLENWAAEPNGSLRCRAGWQKGSTSGLPSTPLRGRGIGFRGAAVRTPDSRQEVTGSFTTSGTVAATWDEPTLEGSLLIAIISAADDSNNVTPTFSAPSGFTAGPAISEATGSGSAGIAMFYKPNAASMSGAVSAATSSASLTWQMTILEVTGIAPLSPLDASDTDEGTTSATLTTSATTQAVEFSIAAAVTDTGANITDLTNFTNDTLGGQHTYAYKNLTATGVQSSAISTGGGVARTEAIMATFKADFPLGGISETLVAHSTGTAYKVYGIEDIETEDWTERDSVTVVSSRPVAFSAGMGGVVYVNPDFATMRRWSGATAAAVTDGPSGRALAFHQDRFFTGGTLTAPTRLYYSKVGDYTDWTTSVDIDDAGYIDIGLEDGSAIESLSVFEGGLLIAKGNSLWFLTGETSDQYSVLPLNGGGAAPGKSTCATPFGIVIADTQTVWLWTGGGVESISEGVENSYEITGYASVDYIDHHAYICDSGTGNIFVVNLETGIWQTETVSDPAEAPAFIAADRDRLLYAPSAGVEASLLQFRSHPKEERIKDFIDETFVMWTPEYRLGGVSKAMTPRRLKLALRQRGEGDEPLMLTPYYDGTAGTTIEIEPKGEGTFVERIGVGEGRGVEKVQFRFSHTCTEDCLMDIEAASLEYDLTDR